MLRLAQSGRSLVGISTSTKTGRSVAHVLFRQEQGSPSTQTPPVTKSLLVHGDDPNDRLVLVDFVVSDDATGHGYVLLQSASHSIVLNTKQDHIQRVDAGSAPGSICSKLFWSEATKELVLCQVSTEGFVRFLSSSPGNFSLEVSKEYTVNSGTKFLGFSTLGDRLWSIHSEGSRWLWLSNGSRTGCRCWWSLEGDSSPGKVQSVQFSSDHDALVVVKSGGVLELWTWIEGDRPVRSRVFSIEQEIGLRVLEVIWGNNGYQVVATDQSKSRLLISKGGSSALCSLLDVSLGRIEAVVCCDLYLLGRPQFCLFLDDSSLVIMMEDQVSKHIRISAEDALLPSQLMSETAPGLLSMRNALLKRAEQAEESIARRRQAMQSHSRMIVALETAMASKVATSPDWPEDVFVTNLRTEERVNVRSLQNSTPHIHEDRFSTSIIDAWFHGATSYVAVLLRSNWVDDDDDESFTVGFHLCSPEGDTMHGGFGAINPTECMVWAQVTPRQLSGNDSRLSVHVVSIVSIDTQVRATRHVGTLSVSLQSLLAPGWIRLSDGQLDVDPPRRLFQRRSAAMISKGKSNDSTEVRRMKLFAVDEARLRASLDFTREQSEVLTKDCIDLVPLAQSILTQLRESKDDQGAGGEIDEDVARLLFELQS